MRFRTICLLVAFIIGAILCSSYFMNGSGYLNRYAENALKLDVAPPPSGSVEALYDQKVFLQTRSYQGTARWQKAVEDADLTQANVVGGFACATSRPLDIKSLPFFQNLLTKTIADTSRLANLSKKVYRQKRPYKINTGSICASASGYDYPSGHAMEGWTTALLLAEIYPEKKKQIYQHARSFAESRVICGVHSVSAVEVDEYYAKEILKRLKKLSAFQDDLAQAKIEMLALPRSTETTAVCEQFPPQIVKPFPPKNISTAS